MTATYIDLTDGARAPVRVYLDSGPPTVDGVSVPYTNVMLGTLQFLSDKYKAQGFGKDVQVKPTDPKWATMIRSLADASSGNRELLNEYFPATVSATPPPRVSTAPTGSAGGGSSGGAGGSSGNASLAPVPARNYAIPIAVGSVVTLAAVAAIVAFSRRMKKEG